MIPLRKKKLMNNLMRLHIISKINNNYVKKEILNQKNMNYRILKMIYKLLLAKIISLQMKVSKILSLIIKTTKVVIFIVIFKFWFKEIILNNLMIIANLYSIKMNIYLMKTIIKSKYKFRNDYLYILKHNFIILSNFSEIFKDNYSNLLIFFMLNYI